MKLPILIAMVLYMAMVIWIGVIYSKKTKTSEDYFLGGRGLGPWVTAMSAEASDMSSWLLMGLPGLALYNLAASLIYRNDMIVFVNNLHDFKFRIYDLWIYDFAKQTSPT